MSGEKAETPVVREALKTLAFIFPGARIWRQNSGRKGHVRFASENLPDIVGVQRFGMALFVEVKTATGRLSQEQAEFLADMQQRGCVAGVYAPGVFYMWGMVPDKHMPRTSRGAA